MDSRDSGSTFPEFLFHGQMGLTLVCTGAGGSQEGHLLHTRRLRQVSQRVSYWCLNGLSEIEEPRKSCSFLCSENLAHREFTIAQSRKRIYECSVLCVVCTSPDLMNEWLDEGRSV